MNLCRNFINLSDANQQMLIQHANIRTHVEPLFSLYSYNYDCIYGFVTCNAKRCKINAWYVLVSAAFNLSSRHTTVQRVIMTQSYFDSSFEVRQVYTSCTFANRWLKNGSNSKNTERTNQHYWHVTEENEIFKQNKQQNDESYKAQCARVYNFVREWKRSSIAQKD